VKSLDGSEPWLAFAFGALYFLVPAARDLRVLAQDAAGRPTRSTPMPWVFADRRFQDELRLLDAAGG
jgi:hypothetical protein